MSQKFAGKVVIVTGSSSGIGQGTAILLAQQGASVTLHGLVIDGIPETIEIIKKSGVSEDKIHYVLGDISQHEVTQKLIDETLEKFRKIDVVVNCAGILSTHGRDPEENFDRVFDINVKSIMRLNALAIPHLEKTKGNIVNISSVGSMAVLRDARYCMSKAALDHYMRHEAKFVAGKGIRVNNINPGFVPTNLHPDSGMPKEMIGQFKEAVITGTPLGRAGRPQDMANCVSFLASDEASFITGTNLICDGGARLGGYVQ
ncbi:hypothetical protein L596_026802 [Steinernema carpocapsae]|uniref:Uncharacterized protein n=1 Tax=Steinernema carpocapsae TaxID=34508 RepID=A0A4U5M2H5_STECR|nr:hypothetical protein L596_026802 [Steinernema carpocapsae]